jgi:predicted metal-binding membrane protein
MESALLRRALARPRPIDIALVASLVVLAGAAWVLTGDRMDGMDAGPGTDLGGLGWFAGIWVTMMAAMMLRSCRWCPSRASIGRSGRGVVLTGANAVFVAGYLLTWAPLDCRYMIVEVRELDPASSPGMSWGPTSRAQ